VINACVPYKENFGENSVYAQSWRQICNLSHDECGDGGSGVISFNTYEV